MVLLALLLYFSPSLTHSVCVCVCVCVFLRVCATAMAISMAVAAGHGKSSVLPLIVLITSLGAASPHTRWPRPLLWNHALLTQRWWCHRAQGGMMVEEEEEEEARGVEEERRKVEKSQL